MQGSRIDNKLSLRVLNAEDLYKKRMKYMDHSIKLLQIKGKEIPLNYKAASLALKYMKNYQLNLHEAIDKVALIEPLKEKNSEVEDLLRITLNHEQEINYLIKRVKILEDNLDLDPFLIKVSIAEMLWGKLFIKFNSLDSIYLKYYEADIKEAFIETTTVFDSAEDSYSSKLPVYVRINTLAISLDSSMNAFYKEGWNFLPRSLTYINFLNDVRQLQKNECIRDFHISELLVFPPGTSFYEHPGYLEGKFFIQDKGSCLSTFLLNPKPGSCVLDMFAAPGSTTNHIANMMKNEGIIYACDHHPNRLNRLNSLMQLTNVTCVEPMNNACWDIRMNDLNYILLDVPSTYSGIHHKKDIKGLLNQTRYLRHKSSLMLLHALHNFPNVKRVVYTSCSIFPDEGEKVVANALKELCNSYTLLDVKEMLWKEWITIGNTDTYHFGEKCLRTNPEFDLCQGYFIAVFERNYSVAVPPCPIKIRTTFEISNEIRPIKKPKKATIIAAVTAITTKKKPKVKKKQNTILSKTITKKARWTKTQKKEKKTTLIIAPSQQPPS
ncbi:28S rRNA (cytosine-C(5))-methyltransferase-like isoform X2 [Phymastichus coffea]|uniref:28S rRNA (cytosine-C(5))-methyltransferase-like isoform X2 n=1 Tax=Phymastichus coffea TaxID=108790 RepID=UPI00273AC32B|nr:28S rRNA (cytosine-C(5))-methyltransferase-like isoform X2 [Phymastichus coffea]